MTGEDAIKLIQCAIIKHGTFTLYGEHLPLAKIKELHVYDDKGKKKAVFI